jgi:hypothetical protein
MNKKIIFWLDSDFVQFGLAHQLQKKYESDFYAVVDITNKTKSFFSKTKYNQISETVVLF